MTNLTRKINKFFLGICYIAVLSFFSVLTAAEYNTDDAQRFSLLIQTDKHLSAEDLQQQYLDKQTQGLLILKGRYKNAETILSAFSENPDAYHKATELCLPIAKSIDSQVKNIMGKVAKFLGQSDIPSVSIVFGANNTGGTANATGIVLALEVICQQVNTSQEAQELILDYVAHEIVHVYQYRMSTRTDFNFTLLELSLIEGIADLVAELATEKKSMLELARATYGQKNETRLWSEFQPMMHEYTLYPWIYGTPTDGRPADLGYWIGKQIAAAYLSNQEDKHQALMSLLALSDAKKLLVDSRFLEE